MKTKITYALVPCPKKKGAEAKKVTGESSKHAEDLGLNADGTVQQPSLFEEIGQA